MRQSDYGDEIHGVLAGTMNDRLFINTDNQCLWLLLNRATLAGLDKQGARLGDEITLRFTGWDTAIPEIKTDQYPLLITAPTD